MIHNCRIAEHNHQIMPGMFLSLACPPRGPMDCFILRVNADPLYGLGIAESSGKVGEVIPVSVVYPPRPVRGRR